MLIYFINLIPNIRQNPLKTYNKLAEPFSSEKNSSHALNTTSSDLWNAETRHSIRCKTCQTNMIRSVNI